MPTRDRHADESRQRLRRLHEGPRPGEVARPHPLHGEHLEGVEGAAEAGAVQPEEEDVAMVAAHRAQGQQGESAAQQGQLAQALPAHVAVRAAPRAQHPTDQAAQRRRQPKNHLHTQNKPKVAYFQLFTIITKGYPIQIFR